MVRIIVILALIFGGIALAKDGSVQTPGAAVDGAEQFWASEEGADVKRLMEKFHNGEITMEDARKQYNSRWGQTPPSGAQAVPNAPVGKF